jgi:hypothetical protein
MMQTLGKNKYISCSALQRAVLSFKYAIAGFPSPFTRIASWSGRSECFVFGGFGSLSGASD